MAIPAKISAIAVTRLAGRVSCNAALNTVISSTRQLLRNKDGILFHPRLLAAPQDAIPKKLLILIYLLLAFKIRYIDLPTEPKGVNGILIGNLMNHFRIYSLHFHEGSGLWYGQWIRNPPVSSRIHHYPLSSILFNDFDHTFVTHFGKRIDRKCRPKPLVKHTLDRLLIIMIDHHPAWI